MAIGMLSLFRAADAAAQPRWGYEHMPRAGACFYEDKDFHGRYFCVTPGQDLRRMPNGMGDRISSMRVVGPLEVTVFRDNDMHGRSAHFISDVRDLRRDGWNDQISSLVVSEHGNASHGTWQGDRVPVWGRESLPREGACFYEGPNFSGQYFCVPRGATYTSLPRGFNDRIVSIRVFGSGVRIYQNSDFHGRAREINHDVANLHGEWRDTISSVRVY
jgi:hypothetical protein